MRQFIKEHPWRLEIVPFIVIVLAGLVPILYGIQIVKHMSALNNFARTETYLIRYIFRVFLLLSLWPILIQQNHEWVLAETKKRFDYVAVAWTMLIALCGWYVSQWFLAPFWLVTIAAATILQIVIEAQRPYIPRTIQKQSDTDINLQPGILFYYREDRSQLWLGVLIYNPIIWWRWCIWSTAGKTDDLTVAIIVSVIVLLFLPFIPRLTCVVSNELIAVRFGWLWQQTVRLDEVKTCSVVNYTPDDYPISRKSRVWKFIGQIAFAPKADILRVETLYAETYHFAFKNAKEACSIINAALEARRSENQQ